jgi:hypothetical protein
MEAPRQRGERKREKEREREMKEIKRVREWARRVVA